MPRYACIESTDTISASRASATSMPIELLPAAVGCQGRQDPVVESPALGPFREGAAGGERSRRMSAGDDQDARAAEGSLHRPGELASLNHRRARVGRGAGAGRLRERRDHGGSPDVEQVEAADGAVVELALEKWSLPRA